MLNNNLQRCFPALILALMFAVLSGCATGQSKSVDRSAAPKSETYFIFDTAVTVKIFDDRVNDRHFEDIYSLLKAIDDKMNRTVEASEISQVNRQAGMQYVTVSDETFELVGKAKKYAEMTEGRFDPTVGPLVDLWHIGKEGAHVPDNASISEKLALVDYKQIKLDEANRSIFLAKEGMELDLGAIAKGYAGDVIAQYLSSQDFHRAIIDLGGNVLAMGLKPGDIPWTIGIQDPDPDAARGTAIGTVRVTDKTVVSSGVYERFFVENGRRYHHIFDTETGYPVDNGLVSVTIITDVSADADALSTSIFSMGLERGLAFAESIENIEAIFINANHGVYVTGGLEDFVVTSPDYKLMASAKRKAPNASLEH